MELLPMTESLRESARKSKLRAGTKGLAEGNQRHMLDAAQLIYLAWGDVTQKTIARCWARASTLPEHHQAKLTGGSATASIHEEGIPDMENMSAAVDDLSRMLLAIDNAQTDPYAMELIGTWRELGVEPERAEDLAKDYHDQDFTRSTEAGGDKQAVVTKEGTVTEEKKEDAAEAPLQADEVARDAIEEFVLPAGWERVPSPKGKSANRSPMWSFGVKARRIGAESGKSGKMYAFFCLGGEACRQRSAQSSVTVYVGEMTNSNAIKHIRAFHAVKSSVTDRRDEPTRSFSEKKGDEIVSSLAMKDNPSRTMALEVVKAFVIQEFCSLSFGEKESMRVCWNVTCKEGFPVMGLHRQAVKHNIVELYNATVSRFRDELKAHTAKRQMLHVNFELWTDMFSNLTFLDRFCSR